MHSEDKIESDRQEKVSWLEFSITVDGELAEAVAELLSRFTSNGVVTEQGVKYNDEETAGEPFGPVRVYGYILADENIESTRRALDEAFWHLGQIQPLPEPQYRKVDDQNWMEIFKQHYHPISIGKKLVILPAWAEHTETDRHPVRIDPSMAFGTGTHPSTQMCMEFVEDYTMAGRPAIDVGCGSGILSIAAIRMGASHALAVDVDRPSIRSTMENAVLNQVEPCIESGLGSLQEIKQGNYSIDRAPLVLVNILAPIILRLFQQGLADLLEDDGVLVLSGILETQSDSIIEAAGRANLTLLSKRHVNDWVAFAFGQNRR